MDPKKDIPKAYQSYRASLISAYSDARGALLVCTLLPRALNSIERGLTPYSSYLGLSISLCLFSLGMIKAYDIDFVVRMLAGFKLASLK